MGKIRGKIDVSSEKSSSWRDILRNYDVNSRSFNSETFLVVESSSKCLPITDELCEKIGRTEQSRIRAITYEDLERLTQGGIFMEDLEFGDAIKEAKEELLQKHALSTKTLALLIKLQILTIRKQYLSHKDNCYKLEQQLELEKRIFLEFEVQKKKKQEKTKYRPKITIRDKNTTCETINSLGELPSLEIRRTMRESGQSENFIGPFEGVDLYFILSRMYDHDLPTELINIGVNLTAVIDFADNPKDFSAKIYHKTLFENSPKDQFRTTDISNFWANFSTPKTVCYLRYCPRGPSEVYDDLIRIAYNITALKRLHQDYLESMKIIDLEEPGPPVKVRHMKIYQRILQKVPNEHQTAPVILHALLEELFSRLHLEPPEHALKIDKDPPQPPPRPPKDTGQKIKRLFKQFHHKTEKPPKTPVTVHKTKILQYGDVLEYQLSHLPYSNDLKQINIQALKIPEPLQLFKNFPKTQEGQERYYDYLLQKWATGFNYTPTNRLKHCLHAYYLAHGTFQTTPPPPTTPQPPLSGLLFPNYKPYNAETSPEVYLNLLSPHRTPSINKTCKKERFYCEHIEEYDSSTMIQMINVAYNDLERFEYKYLSAHDTILLRFHPRPEDKKVQEIRTPVCFRDFCGHIVGLEIKWLIEQEREYWERKKEQEEEAKLVSINKVYILKEDDFIRPGSIKDRLLKEENDKKKIFVEEKKRIKKTPKDNVSISSQKSDRSTGKKKTTKLEIVVVKDDKKKFFQGYNLGSNYVELRNEKKVYKTFDDITLSLEKDQLLDLETFCVKLVFRDNSILFHGTIKDSLLDINPLIFHIHVSNGIIIGFSPANSLKDPSSKRNTLATSTQKPRKLSNFKDLQSKLHEKLLAEVSNKVYRRTKREVLEKIKAANHGPVFKICSLSLRGYKHVKRTKSHQEIPIMIVKRLLCKPKLRRRPKRRFLVPKCHQKVLPYDFKATLPTGLCVQAVPGTKEQPFYIRQGYIIDRDDLESIEHEDYRCFFKGTVVSFLKSGEVVTMAASKVLERRKFGYFNLEATQEGSKKDRSCNLHKATKDTAEMEKRIKAFHQERGPKRRLESRRGCHEAKRFKMSKNLYQTGYLPVIKLTTVTEDGRKMVAMKNFIEEKDKYFTMTYNNYIHRKIFMCRQDGTSWFLDNEARATTQFKDKTRITTWPVLLDEDFLEESYVLYGLNYKYEHPNYMTVTELCDDQSVTIEMPEVVVRILQGGTFQVVLHDKETIFVDKNINFTPKSCNCGCFSSGVNIRPFFEGKTGIFLKLFDKDNVVTIDYSGNLNETPSSSCSKCNCPKTVPHRFFALKRDLSGAELFIRPTDPRFIYTMTDFQTNPKYSPKNDPIFIQHPLKKTFTENFMMLYDTPSPEPSDDFEDAEEISRFFDYKEKDVISQRTPIFIYERNIKRLQLHLVLESIISGFFKVHNRSKKWRIFKPQNDLLNFLKEHDEREPEISKSPSSKKPKTLQNRCRSLKDIIEDTRELRCRPIPSYFNSKKGFIVTFLIECVDRAMDLSDNKLEEPQPQLEEESSYELKKSGLSPASYSSADSEIFLNLVQFDNNSLPCDRETCDCVYKSPSKSKDYERKPVLVESESIEDNLFGSPDLTDICAEVSVCYKDTLKTTSLPEMPSSILYGRSIQAIACNIIKSLINASVDKNVLTLSGKKIRTIVRESIKNLNLTSNTAIAIIQEMKRQMLRSIRNEKPMYNAAMNIIKEVKNEISQFTSGDVTDYDQQHLHDVTVNVSLIMFDALGEETSTPKVAKAVKCLLQDAQLGINEATLVLEMAAQRLEDDIIGNPDKKDSIESIVADISSETALKILHTTQNILKGSNQSLPALHFDFERGQTIRIKSDTSVIRRLQKEKKSKKCMKGKHVVKKKSVLYNASIDFLDKEESHDKVRENKVKRFASTKK